MAKANGKTPASACLESGITEQTCYRRHKKCGRLKVGQAKRLKDLGQENAGLKSLAGNLVLKDIAPGNVWSTPLLQG